jgi:hypothetical protein
MPSAERYGDAADQLLKERVGPSKRTVAGGTAT